MRGSGLVHIEVAMVAGPVELPAGRYEVSVDEATGRILLENAAVSRRIPATRRSSKVRVKRIAAQLRRVVGEPRWLLVVRVPPATEWVASLEEA